eukprot:scaffold2628_cov113-Isochrysis_galbana.AAC.3
MPAWISFCVSSADLRSSSSSGYVGIAPSDLCFLRSTAATLRLRHKACVPVVKEGRRARSALSQAEQKQRDESGGTHGRGTAAGSRDRRGLVSGQG